MRFLTVRLSGRLPSADALGALGTPIDASQPTRIGGVSSGFVEVWRKIGGETVG
jgi:hypothetical protein